MNKVKTVTIAIKTAMSKSLSDLVLEGLEEANMAILDQSGGTSVGGNSLQAEKQAIVGRFAELLAVNFDALLSDGHREVNVLDYGSLSLVKEEDLEAIIAMEGMIAHSRNCDIEQYLGFTTRLDSMFHGIRIDESNNPMDPEQIGAAFSEAMRPLALSSGELLIVYRRFNSHVFHKLEQVLTQANQILIENDIIPDLDIEARNKKLQINKRSKRREKSDPRERAFSASDQNSAGDAGSSQQLLAMMQNLMHGALTQATADGGPAGNPAMVAAQLPAGQLPATAAGFNVVPAGSPQNMMVGGQRVEMVDNEKLMSLLGDIQSNLVSKTASGESSESSAEINLGESLGDLLRQGNTKEILHAIDGQSSDIINLVMLLYDAIWHDETVPIPVKELIGRTQITILKIALQDSTFFDIDDHPVRVLINELATAGISWTNFDKLEHDPMYRKMQELVERLISEYESGSELIEDLIQDFRSFKQAQRLETEEEEVRLKDADERENRLEEINSYAHAKITDRILDKNVSPIISNFLETFFRKFVVQVILREGPGGISWKPVMNTIDVLLWTVQDEKGEGDIERYRKVNPRLMANLGKALELAGVEKEEADAALKELRQVQEESFKPRSSSEVVATDKGEELVGEEGEKVSAIESSIEILPDDDEHLLEVSNYPIGIWLEFKAGADHSIRGTLAARIDTIDKYIFVNEQGVKVVEISRMGLAGELKAGTVKVISEAPLIDRAMESVIGKLRETQAQAEEDPATDIEPAPK